MYNSYMLKIRKEEENWKSAVDDNSAYYLQVSYEEDTQKIIRAQS